MAKLTALVIGGTGLVGSQLLAQLVADDRFGKIISFSRRRTGKTSPKLDEQIVDFDQPDAWSARVAGDVAFSALGTTIGQAGSKEAQKKVDYTYQFELAKAAATNGVPTYVLVSSAGANADSISFYSRIKGELDRDVQALGFDRVRIVRPSLLGGDREKSRAGEKIGSALLGAINAIGIAKKYREISADIVAKAMINASLDETKGTKIFTLDEVFVEAEKS